MFYLTLLLYYGSIYLLPLLLWKSKRNINFIQSLPLFFLTYVAGGIYNTNLAISKYGVGQDTINFYGLLLFISFVFTSLSLIYAFYSKTMASITINSVINSIKFNYERFLMVVGRYVSIGVIFLFSLSYYGMGFIPMFADNPFAAKFFVGEYQASYAPYAIPFRLALLLGPLCITVLLVRFSKQKKFFDLLLLFFITVLMVVSLRRATMADSIITFLLILPIFYHRKAYWFILTLCYGAYLFGSAFNDIYLNFMGLGPPPDFSSLLRGVPDISDQLWFLNSWRLGNWDITWGKTILGGIVPFHYEFNPAVLTKLVIGADPDSAATGGFRLPMPVWGYVSFSWFGVVVFSIIHGYLLGTVLKLTKRHLNNVNSIIEFTLLTIIFESLYTIANFSLHMRLDFVVYTIALIFLFRITSNKENKRVANQLTRSFNNKRGEQRSCLKKVG